MKLAFALSSLLIFSACLPPQAVPPTIPLSVAATQIVAGPAQTSGTSQIETLLSYTVKDADWKALRVRAWGTTGANLNAKSVYLYYGNSLPIAVNVEIAIGWWVVETYIVKNGHSSSIATVGDLSGNTKTHVYSLRDPEPGTEIRVAGKGGSTSGDVYAEYLTVEILK